MRRLALPVAVLLLAGCAPVGSPSTNPDHGPPAPPNGNIMHPERPNGMPADFLYMSWHVLALDEDWEEGPHVPVRIHINATAENAPVQGNVHGGYPLDLYVYTPYTHTIWYAPGIDLVTDIVAIADPGLPTTSPVTLVCIATSSNRVDEPQYENDVFTVNDYCRASWVKGIDEH